MDKRGILILFGIAFLFLTYGVYAENLNLKITGTIGNYSADVYLKTNPSSNNGTDAYDFSAYPDNPSNYSKFYSSASGSNFFVDSWNSNPRTLNLVYHISESQTGELTFLWIALTGSYDATFTNYGNDSTYTTAAAASVNMRASSAYTAIVSGATDIYVRIVVSDYSAPTIPTTPASPGGGGGGVSEKKKEVVSGIEIDTTEIDIETVLNANKERVVKITNNGNKAATISIEQENLDELALFKKEEITLAPGESAEFRIVFVAPGKPGLYTGKIIIGGKEILVSINVRTKELLFDVGIVVPDSDKIISVGDKLSTQVNLIPMGGEPGVDVTLNYVIKDFNGKTYLQESETLLVNEQKTFKKQFNTRSLPAGDYVVGLEVVYPNGVVVSSSHFKISETNGLSKRNVFILAIAGILIFIIIAVFYIFKFEKKRKQLLKGGRHGK